MKNYRRMIISRTDSIGDVILTLPMIGLIKEALPNTKIIFLGKSYTRAVIEACDNIDIFLDWDELSAMEEKDALQKIKNLQADIFIHVFPRLAIARLAKKTKIPVRIGTTNRLYHWWTCNKLVRLSRRKSDLHEAQLNVRLAASITGVNNLPLDKIPDYYGLSKIVPLDKNFADLVDKKKFNLILHPKSKGSAREWGTTNFRQLIGLLSAEKFKIFITGTAAEGKMLKEEGFFENNNLQDLTGSMSLSQLMSFIKECDGLLAASTGPLHLAAALGIHAIGIYPPIRPMHPGRWAPLGIDASYLVNENECNDCRRQGPCHCMEEIRPENVLKILLEKENDKE